MRNSSPGAARHDTLIFKTNFPPQSGALPGSKGLHVPSPFPSFRQRRTPSSLPSKTYTHIPSLSRKKKTRFQAPLLLPNAFTISLNGVLLLQRVSCERARDDPFHAPIQIKSAPLSLSRLLCRRRRLCTLYPGHYPSNGPCRSRSALTAKCSWRALHYARRVDTHCMHTCVRTKAHTRRRLCV